LEAVKRETLSIRFIDESLKLDREIVLETVKQDGISSVDPSFRRDKQIVLEAVKRNGNSLKWVDSSLQRDKQVVLEAVRQNAYSLYFADSSLKKKSIIYFGSSETKWMFNTLCRQITQTR